jgi:hypothetical protein
MAPMPSGIVRAPISDALPPFAKHTNTHTHTHATLFSQAPNCIITYKLAVIFFVAKTRHFASFFLFFSKVPSKMVKGTFWKISKKARHNFKEFFFEISNIFGGFGQIPSFLLLKSPYLVDRFCHI